MSFLKSDMPADEAMRLAKFQRPGVRLIVGAERAREEKIRPLSRWELYKLRDSAR